MKTDKMYACEICEKETRIDKGWHLEGNLNFCSDSCVTRYIEINMRELFKVVANQEKRLSKLEKLLKV